MLGAGSLDDPEGWYREGRGGVCGWEIKLKKFFKIDKYINAYIYVVQCDDFICNILE